MANVKHVKKLEDGREVTINFTEDEHTALMDFAINFFLQQGWMAFTPIEESEKVEPKDLN